MAELQELFNDALAQIEKEEWSMRDDFNQDSCDLRSLGKKIYTGKDGAGKEWVIDVLCGDMEEYKWQVKNFLKKYKKILGKREVVIWKKKLKDTFDFAQDVLGFSLLEEDETSEEEKANPESLAQEVESIEPKVEDIFDATKKEELLLESLPNVPADTDGFFDDHSSVDEIIEARLLKIKFFRKTWCSSEPR